MDWGLKITKKTFTEITSKSTPGTTQFVCLICSIRQKKWAILNKNLIMHPQSVVWTINSHRALLIVVARNDVSVLVCFVKVNNRDQVTAFGWLEILQGMH